MLESLTNGGQRRSARKNLLGMYRSRADSFLCDRCYGRYLQEIRDYSVVWFFLFCFVLRAHLPLLTKQEKLEVCRTSISNLRITWIFFLKNQLIKHIVILRSLTLRGFFWKTSIIGWPDRKKKWRKMALK